MPLMRVGAAVWHVRPESTPVPWGYGWGYGVRCVHVGVRVGAEGGLREGRGIGGGGGLVRGRRLFGDDPCGCIMRWHCTIAQWTLLCRGGSWNYVVFQCSALQHLPYTPLLRHPELYAWGRDDQVWYGGTECLCTRGRGRVCYRWSSGACERRERRDRFSVHREACLQLDGQHSTGVVIDSGMCL